LPIHGDLVSEKQEEKRRQGRETFTLLSHWEKGRLLEKAKRGRTKSVEKNSNLRGGKRRLSNR